MSKVHVSLHRDAAHGKAPITGPMRFAPSKRRSAGQDIILPAGFDVDLVDGEAMVELAATGPDWCWCAYEPTLRGAIRHFLVPDVPDDVVLEYAALTDVDPATLEPSPEALAGWTATLDEVRELRNDAVAVIPLLEPTIAAAQAAKERAEIAAQGANVAQITLTGNLALTIPDGHPAGQVYRCAITQTTGGHTVTYGPDTLAIDTDPGASTLVEIWPGGEVTYPGAVVSGGVTDHGALTGLGDDDHTQYHTDARGDARYSALGHGHTLGAVTDTATRVAMTPAERTKLTGVATGATANATDAQLRDRSTHTGTQTSATLSDLTEVVQDIVGALIVAGTNTTVSYNDAAGTFTINSTAVGGSTDPEVVRDTIGGALVPGSGIQITVNDAGDTITIASTAVLPTRQVAAGTGLAGGGDLSADRTLSVSYGTTAGTAAEGNHTHAGVYAPVLGADDNYVTDAEKAALHTHPAVVAQGATQADARTAIGLGTAATTAATDYATAAQGTKADSALQVATAQPINAQTGTTYTLQASDAGKLVTLTNAGAITLTVPGSVFTTGQRVDCLVLGAGMVTAVGSSCTVNGTPSLVSRAQWSAFTVLFTSATAAVVVGDLASA